MDAGTGGAGEEHGLEVEGEVIDEPVKGEGVEECEGECCGSGAIFEEVGGHGWVLAVGGGFVVEEGDEAEESRDEREDDSERRPRVCCAGPG